MTAPFYQDDAVTLWQGNCREVLPGLPPAMVVTDPPYGTGGWRRTARGQGGNPAGVLVREAWDTGDCAWIADCRGSVVASFFPSSAALRFLETAAVAGLSCHRQIYMHKRDPMPRVGDRPRWSVEPIWIVSRQPFALRGGGTDWLETTTPRTGRDAQATGHPYQKPLDAMMWLLAKLPDGDVIDPFAGSGTTLVAAKNAGRRAIGIEIEPRYCEIAARRLAQETLFKPAPRAAAEQMALPETGE